MLLHPGHCLHAVPPVFTLEDVVLKHALDTEQTIHFPDAAHLRISMCVLLWVITFYFEVVGWGLVNLSSLTEVDYGMMLLVPLTAILFAQPERPWRHFVWCGLVGAIPFVLNSGAKQGEIAYLCALNHRDVSIPACLFPSALILIALPCVAVVAGLSAQEIAKARERRRRCQPRGGG